MSKILGGTKASTSALYKTTLHNKKQLCIKITVMVCTELNLYYLNFICS